MWLSLTRSGWSGSGCTPSFWTWFWPSRISVGTHVPPALQIAIPLIFCLVDSWRRRFISHSLLIWQVCRGKLKLDLRGFQNCWRPRLSYPWRGGGKSVSRLLASSLTKRRNRLEKRKYDQMMLLFAFIMILGKLMKYCSATNIMNILKWISDN